MKKSIKKISIIAAAFLCTSFFSINYTSTKKPLANINHYVPKGRTQSQKNLNLSHLFALGSEENLRSYHYGKSLLVQDYHSPSEADLLDSIRSHSQYKGLLSQDQLLTHNVAVPNEENDFFIYEHALNNQPHFYLSHAKGLRHFTVKNCGDSASLTNGMTKNYPNLDSLILCTT
jgi:hypothetical protein